MANNKKALVIGGIAAALLGVYLWKKKGEGGGSLAPVTSYGPDGPPQLQSDPGIYSPPIIQAPAPASLSSGMADPTQLQVVSAWVQLDGSPPPMVQMLANADPEEIAGMANIISNNLWGDASVRQFWNTLVNKYDPQRKYM